MKSMIAVHEAGHAIVAALFGARDGYVTIIPTNQTGGHCHMAPRGVMETGGIAILSMAGDVAVELFRSGGIDELRTLLHAQCQRRTKNRPPTSHPVDAAPTDQDIVSAMLDLDRVTCDAKEPDDYLVGLAIACNTRDVLAARWHELQVLASELLSHKTVTASRVCEICGITDRVHELLSADTAHQKGIVQ